MFRALIATIDSTHARFFRFERDSDGTHVRETFDEFPALESSKRHLHAHAHDPEQHVKELDMSFARAISAFLATETGPSTTRLVVCASAHMLGDLRRAGIPHREGLTVDELPRELVNLTPPELRDQLVGYGVLPSRD